MPVDNLGDCAQLFCLWCTWLRAAHARVLSSADITSLGWKVDAATQFIQPCTPPAPTTSLPASGKQLAALTRAALDLEHTLAAPPQ